MCLLYVYVMFKLIPILCTHVYSYMFSTVHPPSIKCGYRTLSMSGAMCINLWMNLLNLLQIGITILFLASTMLDLVGWGRNPERDIDSGETFLQIFEYVPPSRYPYWIPLYFFLLLPRLYKEYDTGKLGDGIIWKPCGCF